MAPEDNNAEGAPRAVPAHLATLDDPAFCGASPVEPSFFSHSDPAPQWTGTRGGPAYRAYSTNYLFDIETSVILDAEVTRSIGRADARCVQTMTDRVSDTFGITPEPLIADTAYGRASCSTGWFRSAGSRRIFR